MFFNLLALRRALEEQEQCVSIYVRSFLRNFISCVATFLFSLHICAGNSLCSGS